MLRVARRTRQVAGLLPGASIFGDLGVQAVQIILRILMACQITVCDRRDIERLGIIRDIGQDGLGKCQPPLKGVGLRSILSPRYFLYKWRRRASSCAPAINTTVVLGQ